MYRVHSAAAVCTPLFVLLMRRSALACRTLRAQSQFFASQKNAGLAWIFVPFQTRCIHSAAAVCTPLFVLLMRRSAPACRTLRAQSQFFASQKNAGLAWIFVPFQTRCIHSAAAVCTPLFVLLMRRSAPACRTLRAQSQFFASQKIALVEMRRIELLTPCLQGRCSPS